jgi:uncharacterized RDD family membrane protein YckC
VLSDPEQRGRHDEALGVTREPGSEIRDDDDVDDVDDDDTTDNTPARRGAAATRGPRDPSQRISLFSTEHPPTPPSWPAGFQPPPPRARLLALLIDSLVLLLFVIPVFLSRPIGEQFYPDQYSKIDQIADCIDALESAQDVDRGSDRRVTRIETANQECANVNAVAAFEEGSDPTDNQIDNRIEDAEDAEADVQSETAPAAIGVLLLSLALSLLYLLPSSVRTGRTFGKHMMRIHVVQDDGSKVRFSSAMSRYAIPLVLGYLLFGFLGPLSFVLILFGVLMWPRNPNLQGLHDRLAHTLVVDG